MLSMDLLVASTDAEARELALPEIWAMVASRVTGEFPPLEDPASIRARDLTGREASRVEQGLATAWAGSAATLRPRVERLVEATGADEVLTSGSTFDRDALAASDAAVAELLG